MLKTIHHATQLYHRVLSLPVAIYCSKINKIINFIRMRNNLSLGEKRNGYSKALTTGIICVPKYESGEIIL